MSIGHSGAKLALEKTGGNRGAARDLIRREIYAQAREIADRAACSLKCERDEHSYDPYGCANDGSGCICACHDAAGPYTEQETTR